MHFQPDSYSCASVSIQNACEVLGYHVPLDDIKKLAGTTRRGGTSSRGLYRAIQELGLVPRRYYTRKPDLGWRWISKWAKHQPIIVFLGNNDHYVTITGRVGNKIVVVDSYPEFNKEENGVQALSMREMKRIWSYKGLYWGIRVSKP